MKTQILLFASLVVCSAFAQKKPIALEPPPERVAQIAQWLSETPSAPGASITNRNTWDALAKQKESANALRRAENSLKAGIAPLPDELYLEFSKNGNRENFQKPYFNRTAQLQALTIAECLENKGRFLPAIEERMRAICEERSWTLPAHDGSLGNFNKTRLTIDLGSSARACQLAVARSWLLPVLSKETSELVAREVRRRVLDVYLSAVRRNEPTGNWWIVTENNWNAVCHANVIGAALALEPERLLRAEFIAAMELQNPRYLGGFTPDGYCSEGMGYWNYGFGHELCMALTVLQATGGKVNILGDQRARTAAAYANAYQLEQGKSPFFADGGGSPAPVNFEMLRRVWPGLAPSSRSKPRLFDGQLCEIGLRMSETASPSSESFDALPLRSWFPDGQVLISRSAPNAKVPFGIAIKGGHNGEMHNHNDVGSFTIMLAGKEVACDPGGEIYTRRTFSKDRYKSPMLNSFGHPVPVVDGQLQVGGRSAAAKVLETSFSDNLDRIVLDISKAYKVPSLKKLTRTMTFDRTARVITIRDDVEFSKPAAFSSALVSYADLTAFPGIRLDVAPEGGDIKVETEEIANPGKPSPKRRAYTFTRPIEKGSISFSFTATQN